MAYIFAGLNHFKCNALLYRSQSIPIVKIEAGNSTQSLAQREITNPFYHIQLGEQRSRNQFKTVMSPECDTACCFVFIFLLRVRTVHISH